MYLCKKQAKNITCILENIFVEFLPSIKNCKYLKTSIVFIHSCSLSPKSSSSSAVGS